MLVVSCLLLDDAGGSRLSLGSAVGVSSPIALPCLVEVLDNFCGLQIVGHIVYARFGVILAGVVA